MRQRETERKLPLFKVFGRKFRAHGTACAEGFKADRKHNMIYPSYITDGKVIGREEMSVEFNECAYCYRR